MSSRELKIAIGLGALFFAMVGSSFLPSSIFLGNIKSAVTSDGTVTFHREPLYNNIIIWHHQEVVTKDGRTCNTGLAKSSYEKTDTNDITYKLAPVLMPCVEVGAVHRVTRQFLFFWPTTTETVIEK